jgi:hypothetical protein
VPALFFAQKPPLFSDIRVIQEAEMQDLFSKWIDAKRQKAFELNQQQVEVDRLADKVREATDETETEPVAEETDEKSVFDMQIKSLNLYDAALADLVVSLLVGTDVPEEVAERVRTVYMQAEEERVGCPVLEWTEKGEKNEVA